MQIEHQHELKSVKFERFPRSAIIEAKDEKFLSLTLIVAVTNRAKGTRMEIATSSSFFLILVPLPFSSCVLFSGSLIERFIFVEHFIRRTLCLCFARFHQPLRRSLAFFYGMQI